MALLQGLFYFGTGVWPLLSMRTFLNVTGPKVDLWLVKTVGTLIAVVGSVLFYAGISGAVTPPILLLAIGSAACLTIVDINYVAKGVIANVYLLDAAVELMLIGAWLIAIWIG